MRRSETNRNAAFMRQAGALEEICASKVVPVLRFLLKNRHLFGQYPRVRLLRTMLVLFLAAAWMPLTAHCQLERLTGLEVLRCESVGKAAPAGNSHCDDTACCGWESGHYQLPRYQPPAPVQIWTVVLPAALVMLESGAPAQTNAGTPTAAPPGRPKPWQFSLRAALPARAPSLVA